MANPSSSHHDRDRDRERERVVRERSHHHHRTISSTTLLLILSLVLAVLAVMLSLPSTRGGQSGSAASHAMDALRGGSSRDERGDVNGNGAGLWGSFFNPRRSEALVSREHAVAKRESEVAMREADILANALVTCQPYATVTEVVETMAPLPVQTIYKEVVHYSQNEVAVPTPAPQPTLDANASELTRRVEELIQRETKVAEREKDMGRREESVNRREHDAQRRESWIMEQLIALGNDPQMIEEEYIVEQPAGKRKVKVLPPSEPTTVTHTEIRSVPVSPVSSYSPVPSPASTRPAEFPLPVSFSTRPEPPSIPTTVSEIIYENVPVPVPEPEYEEEEEEETITYRRASPRRRLW